MAGERYDVAVVGGSLAGCASAVFLGRAGLRVALLERHTDPKAYKHLCTTAIQASAVPTIQRFGLDGPIEAAGGLRTGLAMWPAGAGSVTRRATGTATASGGRSSIR